MATPSGDHVDRVYLVGLAKSREGEVVVYSVEGECPDDPEPSSVEPAE